MHISDVTRTVKLTGCLTLVGICVERTITGDYCLHCKQGIGHGKDDSRSCGRHLHIGITSKHQYSLRVSVGGISSSSDAVMLSPC